MFFVDRTLLIVLLWVITERTQPVKILNSKIKLKRLSKNLKIYIVLLLDYQYTYRKRQKIYYR